MMNERLYSPVAAVNDPSLSDSSAAFAEAGFSSPASAWPSISFLMASRMPLMNCVASWEEKRRAISKATQFINGILDAIKNDMEGQADAGDENPASANAAEESESDGSLTAATGE